MGAFSVACLAGAAGGQTFVTYQMAGENLTDPGRGLDNAAIGDVMRLSLTVEHDAVSYAGGKAEMLYDGVVEGDITITEDDFAFPNDPWEVGRHVLHRIVASDGPGDSTQPYNVEVIASDPLGGKITDVNDDFFDFASLPPGLGGIGFFVIESGDPIFVFDYVYRGGEDRWDAGHPGAAFIWAEGGDINPTEVPAFSGDTLIVSPAPGVMAAMGIAGVCAGRRRA